MSSIRLPSHPDFTHYLLQGSRMRATLSFVQLLIRFTSTKWRTHLSLTHFNAFVSIEVPIHIFGLLQFNYILHLPTLSLFENTCTRWTKTAATATTLLFFFSYWIFHYCPSKCIQPIPLSLFHLPYVTINTAQLSWGNFI